jgi:hypothetical protein
MEFPESSFIPSLPFFANRATIVAIERANTTEALCHGEMKGDYHYRW